MFVAASKASVTPLIAETTTTGAASRSLATIRATLSNALASATDVPPNFITIDIDATDYTHKHGSESPIRVFIRVYFVAYLEACGATYFTNFKSTNASSLSIESRPI